MIDREEELVNVGGGESERIWGGWDSLIGVCIKGVWDIYMMIEIYCEGGCKGKRKEGGGWGFVMRGIRGMEWKVLLGDVGGGWRKNMGELLGVRKGLKVVWGL